MTHVLAIPDELAQRLQRIAETHEESTPDDDWKRLALAQLEGYCESYEQDPGGE
jgi:predicted transcriptional regulator